MLKFKKITKTNGFDTNTPQNAIQNSYAWSMAELDGYIYVGTCRNMLTSIMKSYGAQNINFSEQENEDNNAEIWRYKKDGTCSWQKVFETDPYDQAFGFRVMTTHKSNDFCAIYAATIGKNILLFKSTDGTHWIKLDTSNLTGQSSRALVSFNGKLYISTLKEGIGGNIPYLYCSSDPEFEPFKPVINTKSPTFNKYQNPMGGIDELQVFNNKLYVGIETENGAEVWRSNTCNPKTNDWTLVADKGFGDSANKNIMSSGIFKNYLYIAVTKLIPLSFYTPFGFDLIRINKYDEWEIVVGSNPLIPSCPTTGQRNSSLSGFNSGFNNYFNVYGWQIKSFKNNLVITTFDNSTNIKTILNTIINNKEHYIKNVGEENYETIIKSYSKILYLLRKYKYPKGFDIYTSKDGCHFKPEILSGFNNPCNYGGRTLLVSCDNKLYLGTANPYCGCEVWKGDYINSNYSTNKAKCYFYNISKLNTELIKIYPDLLKALESMPFFQN